MREMQAETQCVIAVHRARDELPVGCCELKEATRKSIHEWASWR